MRILYVAAVRLPTEKAHGAQIIKTCEALGAAGETLMLITPTRKNSITDDPFAYYGVQKNFTHETISAPDMVAWGPLGFLFSLLWFSEATRHTKTFNESDVVYSRDHLVLLQYILLGHPLVFEAHQEPNFFSLLVAHAARNLVVISEGLKQAYMHAGIREEKIVIAPDAVDFTRFAISETKDAARAKTGIPLDRAVALYLGHLYPRKGAGTLAEAAHFMPDVHVGFVGGTEADIRAFKATWGNEKNIKIAGHKPPEKIPLFLRAADVLVLPNSGKDPDSARFTSPMKLFEYMASGTPIVASDVSALREVLNDETAYFVRPDDPSALEKGIRRALSDPEASERGRAAQEAARGHSWQNRAKRIMSALNSSI